ncbi:MAG: hypothetical protein DSY42_06920 [Aquifex sp.]|nr:MAG: hypothetical protein DSY42_06920 [Aquifex sp.]
MSVKLKLEKQSEDSLTLEATDQPVVFSEELSDYEEIFPEITIAFDKDGSVSYFHIDLWAGPSFLNDIISYFESHPVSGKYTVEELGLYDVPFVEVLKAVKKRYEEKQKVSV